MVYIFAREIEAYLFKSLFFGDKRYQTRTHFKKHAGDFTL